MRVNGPYLKAENGVIAVIPGDEEIKKKLSGIKAATLSFAMVEEGIVLSVGDIDFALPDSVVDYLAVRQAFTVFMFGSEIELLDPVLTIEIPLASLAEAKGIYRYWKENQGMAG